MDQNKEMLELMKKLEKSNRRGNFLSLLQCLFMLVAAVCCVLVLIQVFTVLPQITQLMDQMETVLINLEEATGDLTNLDLGGMIADVDTLVVTGQQTLEATMEKLNSLDIETLNKTIQDLADVVEPLAKLTKVFQ